MYLYQSPIDVIVEKMQTKFENGVFEAIQKQGILVDKEELIKALQYDRGQYEKGYADGLRERSEWISVEEWLPEECKNVLCFASNKTMIAFMEKVEDCGEYVPVFWDWVAYDRDDTYDEVCATHWMPLPDTPNEIKHKHATQKASEEA